MFLRPDGGAVTFWQYLQAEEVEGFDAARKKPRLAAGVPPFADLERDARAAGGGHFAALRDQLDAAIAAWDRLAAVLEAQAAADAPPTRRLRKLLDALLRITSRYAPERAAAAPPDEQPAAAGEAAAEGAPAGSAARTATRADMLRDLARIAEFFRRAEPQSPLPLTLDEAIRRARLSWPELLREVVPNEDARNAMLVMPGHAGHPPDQAGGKENHGDGPGRRDPWLRCSVAQRDRRRVHPARERWQAASTGHRSTSATIHARRGRSASTDATQGGTAHHRHWPRCAAWPVASSRSRWRTDGRG